MSQCGLGFVGSVPTWTNSISIAARRCEVEKHAIISLT